MTPSSIRVFGFGGAGCRFVDDLRASAGDRLGAWVADTDVSVLSALRAVPRECRHTIGDNQFVSGSGGDVARVRATALAENEVFRAALDGVALAVAVAGLGGGTGGGALPVFLEAARERNVRTIVFAVKPFRFEGVERLRAASSAAQTLATLGDIRVFPSNDDLAGAGDGDPSADEALSRASARLGEGLALFWRLCADPGFLHLDAGTLGAIATEGRGEADFAVAEASEGDRLSAVLSSLWDAPGTGLRRRAASARAALVGVIGGDDLRLSELAAVSHSFESAFPASFPLRLSTVSDPAASGSLRVVAFLFRSWQSAEREEARAAELAAAKSGGEGGVTPAQDPLVDARGRRMPGRFDRVAGTFVGGENLDIPTYLRRNLRIDAT